MSSVIIAGDTSGSVTLSAPATAGSTTLTLPSTSGIIVATPTGTVASGQLQTEIFTAPGTWTKPAACTFVSVRVVGGAGGGGAASGLTSKGGNGGHGGYAFSTSVPVSGPVAITIGSAGTGVTYPSPGTVAPSGSTSSFGSLVSCTGGSGGQSSPGPVAGTNGTAGVGTVSSGTTIGLGASGLQDVYTGQYTLGTVSATTAAQTYSIPASQEAGGSGAGGSAPGANPGRGGTSGVVVVEYVG
jgi:hypothetical protein